MNNGVKLMAAGVITFFVVKGAETVFYASTNPVLNIWTLYLLVIVLWYIVKELVSLCRSKEKRENESRFP